jgi:hypothetical protein
MPASQTNVYQRGEEKDLHDYVATYGGQIDRKVQKVLQQSWLMPAV